MKLLIISCYDENAPSARVRVYQYLPFLDKNGVKYKLLPIIHTNYNRMNSLLFRSLSIFIRSYIIFFYSILISKNYDAIFLHRTIFPLGYRLLPLFFKKIIYDFDDALFLRPDGEYGLISKMIFFIYAKSFENMLSISTHVLTTNNFNKNYAKQFCENITMIPGPIDSNRYKPPHNKILAKKKITLGWIGSSSTAQYLVEIEDALVELKKKYPIAIKFVGSSSFEILKNVDFVGKEWSYEDELADLNDFDIGIMPLPNTEWIKGKGAYKLLQYMAMGIPSVSTPVGIVSEIVEDGVNGFTARDNHEWVTKIASLIEDPELRKKMGNNARLTIENKYSLIKASQKFIEVLLL